MRFKSWIFNFLAFCEAKQWTEHENMYFQDTLSISFSTLDEAKAKCVEIYECSGITKNSGTQYELRKGYLMETPQAYRPETTWVKTKWSEGHTGKYIPGWTSYSSSAFSVLDDAKDKCIELVVIGDDCGGV